jgi:predicted nicotinamide N-methyase
VTDPAPPGTRALKVALGPALPELTVFRPVDQEALIARALSGADAALPDGGTPYYAELWPAAVPLALWLIEQPERTRGERVLELGCGLGLTGLALARVSGARVALTDGSPAALDLVRAALPLNGPFEHEPVVATLDWREPDTAVAALGGKFPTVVGADVLYEPASFSALASAARASLAPGGTLYLAEPQRPVARGARTHLEARGLVLERRAEARNGVVVQVWRG